MSLSQPIKPPSVLSLALPIAMETLFRNLISTCNVFLLAGFADEAAAGVGVANQVINIVIFVSMAISVGASMIINHDLGAGDREKASVSVCNSLSVAFLLGSGIALFLVLTAPTLMELVGLTGLTLTYGGGYLRITGIAALFMALSQVISTVFRSYKDARTSMIILSCVNAFNLFLNFLAVKNHLPFDPVTGVAWARVVSEGLVLLILFIFMVRRGHGFRFRNLFRLDRRRILQMLGVGASSIGESLSYNLGTLLTTGFINRIPEASLALSAKVYVCSVNGYEQIIGNALGNAGQIITGQMIGAGEYDRAQKRINSLWKYLVIANLTCSGLLFFFHKPLMGLFTDDPKVIAMTTPLFLLEIIVNFSRTGSHCFNFGNRAAGYVLWPGVVAVVSLWTIYITCGYLFCNVMGLGITGIWMAMAIDESTRGIFSATVWLTKRWQKKYIRS